MRSKFANIQPKGRIWTVSGQELDLNSLLVAQNCSISPQDIAHALAMICRFNGHVPKFYCVALHSIYVSDYLSQYGVYMELLGLIHDATEIFMGDVITPIKDLIPDIRELEYEFNVIIFKSLKIRLPNSDELKLLKEADNAIYQRERNWINEQTNNCIQPLPPLGAKNVWLSRYNKLTCSL